MKILVYLGAFEGKSELFKEATKEVGTWIAKNQNSLIYGGNKEGLMGILADEVLKNGGEVLGVMPHTLETEVPHENLTKLVYTDDMMQRKKYMLDNSDVCIALPGGAGTLDEITEAFSLYRVYEHRNPCIFFNKNGYWNFIKKMYDEMVENGFLSKEDREDLLFSEDFSEIEMFIKKIKDKNKG